jgi:hypothetical protein
MRLVEKKQSYLLVPFKLGCQKVDRTKGTQAMALKKQIVKRTARIVIYIARVVN